MQTDVYILTARRWNNDNDHNYTLGVFTNLKKAIKVANDHKAYRGGKYEISIEKCRINFFNEDHITYTEEVYNTSAETRKF